MTRPKDTAVPTVNFTITSAERVNALVSGPPAWAVRRRRIEDLEARLVRALAEQDAEEADACGEPWPRELEADFAKLVALVDAHNRWYPIEANLFMDPQTSRYVDHGEPWRPMPRPTRAALLARACLSSRV